MNKINLHTLLQHPHLWRASDTPAIQDHHCSTHSNNGTTSSGYALFDELLYHNNTQGGWPHSSSCELLSDQTGIGELRFLMPSLVRASNENRWITWVAPPFIPYAPALHAHGIDLNKLLIIHSKTLKDSLWATEQCLQSGACSAVLAWPQGANYQQLRRLQIAAKAGKSRGIFFRSAQAAKEASPAPLRICIARNTTFRLKIIKRPGGWASQSIRIPLIDEEALTQTATLQTPSLQPDESKTLNLENGIATNQPQKQAQAQAQTQLKNDIPLSKGGSYVVDVSSLS